MRNSRFLDNQTGILTGANPASDVVIEHSEFARSRAPVGNPHGIYIGAIRSFTLKASHVHGSRVGHQVKTRAAMNRILYNLITDGTDGNSSYSIDIPDGGVGYVIGNIVQKGPKTENHMLISYGEEKRTRHEVVGNTFVNDGPTGVWVRVLGEVARVRVLHNLLVGANRLLDGPGETTGNVTADASALLDMPRLDFRPRPGVQIAQGVSPGIANGIDLRPTHQYVHPLKLAPRTPRRALEVGALTAASGD